MNWQDKIKQVCVRVLSPEIAAEIDLDGQVDLPYWRKQDIEDHLRAAHLEILGWVDPDELQAIRSTAVEAITGPVTTTGGITSVPLPLTAIRLIGVSIDGAPAARAGVANFYQRLPAENKFSNCYSFFDGKCAFKGSAIKLVIVKEPTLQQFRDNAIILPQGYDLKAIDLAVKRLMVADYESNRQP